MCLGHWKSEILNQEIEIYRISDIMKIGNNSCDILTYIREFKQDIDDILLDWPNDV